MNVFRSDGDITQSCREVSARQKGIVTDPDDMLFATITDPVFFIDNNALDVLPAGGSCTYSEVQYPAVAYGDSAIAVFPDEAEHLVALRAAITAAQYKLNFEEDIELYGGIITTLKAQYTEGVQAMKAGEITPLQQGK